MRRAAVESKTKQTASALRTVDLSCDGEQFRKDGYDAKF